MPLALIDTHMEDAAAEHVALLLKHVDAKERRPLWCEIQERIRWRTVLRVVHILCSLVVLALFAIFGLKDTYLLLTLSKIFIVAPVAASVKPKGILGDFMVIMLALLSFR